MCGVMIGVKLLSLTGCLTRVETGSYGDWIQTDTPQRSYTALDLCTPDPSRPAEVAAPDWPDTLPANQHHSS